MKIVFEIVDLFLLSQLSIGKGQSLTWTEQLNSESYDVQFLHQNSNDSTRDQGTKVTNPRMDEEASDDVKGVSFLTRLHLTHSRRCF